MNSVRLDRNLNTYLICQLPWSRRSFIVVDSITKTSSIASRISYVCCDYLLYWYKNSSSQYIIYLYVVFLKTSIDIPESRLLVKPGRLF